MTWRIAKSLDVLRDEVNQRWPGRNKASDGVIGDAAHAATASDHNANPQGVVCAFDITHDPNGCDGHYLAELLRTWRHPDVKYVIWDHRIFSSQARGAVGAFEWRPYTGDPHTNHVHVSVGVGRDGQSQPPYDDLDPWGVLVPTEGDDVRLEVDDPIVDELLVRLKALHVGNWIDRNGSGDLQWFQDQFDNAITRNVDAIATAIAKKLKP